MTSIPTARLSLRPLKKATPRNIAWLRNPDVVRFSEQRHRQHNLSSQLRYIESFVGRSCLWGIYTIEHGEHIGNISAVHDEPNSVTDVGIMIGETHLWGKGYASEAWIAACNWLLNRDYGNVRKLECGCMKSNEAMVRLARKSSFVHEGERLNRYLLDGSPISAVMFGRAK